MSFIPGLGIVKGMTAMFLRFFAPKATIQYPETDPDVAVRFRGRLQLLYDELGNLKCETCFQCAAACPIECIDMGGHDTKGRFWVHWGPPETYAERREESALRRSGMPVPNDRPVAFEPIDTAAVERILDAHDYDPAQMLAMLDEVQRSYGHVPVAAIMRISQLTGAPYARIYGLATSYRHLHFVGAGRALAVCRCTDCLLAGAGRVAATLRAELGDTAVETLTAHTPGAASPLVTLDGRPQSVSEQGAAAWARSLAGKVLA